MTNHTVERSGDDRKDASITKASTTPLTTTPNPAARGGSFPRARNRAIVGGTSTPF